MSTECVFDTTIYLARTFFSSKFKHSFLKMQDFVFCLNQNSARYDCFEKSISFFYSQSACRGLYPIYAVFFFVLAVFYFQARCVISASFLFYSFITLSALILLLQQVVETESEYEESEEEEEANDREEAEELGVDQEEEDYYVWHSTGPGSSSD